MSRHSGSSELLALSDEELMQIAEYAVVTLTDKKLFALVCRRFRALVNDSTFRRDKATKRSLLRPGLKIQAVKDRSDDGIGFIIEDMERKLITDSSGQTKVESEGMKSTSVIYRPEIKTVERRLIDLQDGEHYLEDRLATGEFRYYVVGPTRLSSVTDYRRTICYEYDAGHLENYVVYGDSFDNYLVAFPESGGLTIIYLAAIFKMSSPADWAKKNVLEVKFYGDYGEEIKPTITKCFLLATQDPNRIHLYYLHFVAVGKDGETYNIFVKYQSGSFIAESSRIGIRNIKSCDPYVSVLSDRAYQSVLVGTDEDGYYIASRDFIYKRKVTFVDQSAGEVMPSRVFIAAYPARYSYIISDEGRVYGVTFHGIPVDDNTDVQVKVFPIRKDKKIMYGSSHKKILFYRDVLTSKQDAMLLHGIHMVFDDGSLLDWLDDSLVFEPPSDIPCITIVDSGRQQRIVSLAQCLRESNIYTLLLSDEGRVFVYFQRNPRNSRNWYSYLQDKKFKKEMRARLGESTSISEKIWRLNLKDDQNRLLVVNRIEYVGRSVDFLYFTCNALYLCGKSTGGRLIRVCNTDTYSLLSSDPNNDSVENHSGDERAIVRDPNIPMGGIQAPSILPLDIPKPEGAGGDTGLGSPMSTFSMVGDEERQELLVDDSEEQLAWYEQLCWKC